MQNCFRRTLRILVLYRPDIVEKPPLVSIVEALSVERGCCLGGLLGVL